MIKQKIPTCNVELMKDTVRETKLQPKVVKSIISQYVQYIADTIKSGAYEKVLIPYFGKFKPKTKRIQHFYNNKGRTKQTWNPSSESQKPTS